jgi:hypothetical protein
MCESEDWWVPPKLVIIRQFWVVTEA